MRTPLKVAIVAPWGERLGGAEEMLWSWLRNCDRRHLEPMVIFLSDGPLVDEVRQLGFRADGMQAGRLRQPLSVVRTVSRIAAFLRSNRPDVLVNWSAKAQLYGGMAAIGAGMSSRTVWWQHQIPSGHWLDRLATRLPAKAIGCSSRAGQKTQDLIRPGRPSFVINPGIDPDKAPPAAPRAQLGIPGDTTVVGIVGRLQPWKGQDRFLAAIADLRRRGRDVHALVVGGDAGGFSPEYARSIERMVDDPVLAGQVTMTGQVPDSAPYLGVMDIAVNASDNEPFGIVILEAMAAGVPVVAVANGGPADIVEPGISGILADSGKPADLADAIDYLLTDPVQRSSMAAAGQKRCYERFTAKQMTDALTGQLTEIANA